MGTDKIDRDRLARVRSLNAMDDQFFRVLAKDKEVCEEILRTVLDDPGLKVEESLVQDDLTNLFARSVVMDALCLMGDGSRCCVEVQRADNDAHTRRVRYVRSSTDVALARKGIRYADLPTVIVVFLSSFDPIGSGLTTYHVDKVVRETGARLDDGTLDVYVNSAVDDGSKAARLMAYMKDSNGENSEFPHLSGRVSYFKDTEKGRVHMSDLVEEYAREMATKSARESALQTLTTGVKNLMETLGLTATFALDALKVAEPERSEVLALLAQ